MTDSQRKLLLTALKFVVSAALIYFIFTKINFADVIKIIKRAKAYYLFLALLLFVISKIFNALRLNLYFHGIGVCLTQKSNFKLYILGMFYNLFLPGGIGGDAYKGYLIQKKFQVGTKKVVGVLLLDRLSGMLLIFIYSCILALLLSPKILNPFKGLIIALVPLSVFIFWLVQKHFFKYALKVFWGSFGYSALLQAIQLLALFFVLKALAIQIDEIAYLFIFMISSIVSVIPLTIGGIGSREVTFLYGAKWLNLDPNTAIGISMVFFLITALVSLVGVFYHFKKPKLKVT
ncbi:MAG: flippase-like domain-containing protein [Croceitalea sp.]|nr:flippase-like domain-containing protein [Croceitalea sp.]NNC34995.1 flippase-like domain-containing protein [Croceitalea sp.]NNL08059.1 flippase-like domain-containing protein [Croceitalea sp.]